MSNTLQGVLWASNNNILTITKITIQLYCNELFSLVELFIGIFEKFPYSFHQLREKKKEKKKEKKN